MPPEHSLPCTAVQELLDSYLDGECSYHEYSQVLLHVDKCSLCAQQLAQTNLLVGQLQSLPRLKISCCLTSKDWLSILSDQDRLKFSSSPKLYSLRNRKESLKSIVIAALNFLAQHFSLS